jgi:Fe2+ or Zn2+ uptake regulation protein
MRRVHESWRHGETWDVPKLVERTGTTPSTVKRALNTLAEEGGLFAKRVVRTFQEGQWRSAIQLTPRQSGGVVDQLKAAATVVPETTPHGVRRTPHCPLHPDARVITRRMLVCSECGQVLKDQSNDSPQRQRSTHPSYVLKEAKLSFQTREPLKAQIALSDDSRGLTVAPIPQIAESDGQRPPPSPGVCPCGKTLMGLEVPRGRCFWCTPGPAARSPTRVETTAPAGELQGGREATRGGPSCPSDVAPSGSLRNSGTRKVGPRGGSR